MPSHFPLRRILCPLKSDKAPSQSFSNLYIILIICTIVLLSFYSLPLRDRNNSLKPLNNKLMPTLKYEKRFYESSGSEENSFLSELFGHITSTISSVLNTSLSAISNSADTEIKDTTLPLQKVPNFHDRKSTFKDEKFIDEPMIPVTNRDSSDSSKDETNSGGKNNEKKESGKTYGENDVENEFGRNGGENKSENNDGENKSENNDGENESEKNDRQNESGNNEGENKSENNDNGKDESGKNEGENKSEKDEGENHSGKNDGENKSEKNDGENRSGKNDGENEYGNNEGENKSETNENGKDESGKHDGENKSEKNDEERKESASLSNINKDSTTSFGTDSDSVTLNTTTEFLPSDEFLVLSEHCKIPNINPYHPSILKYVEHSPPLVCNAEKPLTETEGNTMYIDEEAVRMRHLNSSEITCIYMEISRSKEGSSDDAFEFGKNHTFVDKVEIEAEFIRVVCSTLNGSKIYEGFHTFVHDKPKVEERCSKYNSSGYSVLIVGIDAMSRLNMHRQLKKTARYLLKDMGAVEMYGFNKVGDNTFPNIMPLLTGLDERELKYVCWDGSRKTPLDKCNFLWNQYAKEGYRTLYAEDSPHMSSFNYVKEGFHYQPTDFYFRHFMLVIQKILGTKKMLNTYPCLGNVSETELVLQWTEQFASHFKDRKYFTFSWINGLTHDFLNKGSSVDHIYEKFFRNLHVSGALNKTIIVAMGDHGMRWGSIRNTYIGRLEERLPMLLIALPPEFKKQYPAQTEALELNSRRLVTPFDLHATLMNILHVDQNVTFHFVDDLPSELAQNYSKRAYSLFQPVPESRSCDDAFIDEHWCTCESSLPVDTDDKSVQKAATFLIDHINSLLKPVRNKCAILKLKSITDARVWMPFEEHHHHTKNDKILTIIVKVWPSAAIFEGTVRSSKPKMNQELLGTVSRLNLYGNQSACIDDAILRKYCYCS